MAQGTLVRVWDTTSGQQKKEVRRGADKAEIYSLNFSAEPGLLTLTSDKGTCHVFGVLDKYLDFLSRYLPLQNK